MVDGIKDQIFGEVEFAFKGARFSVRDVGFEVKRTMFGVRDEARSDGDVTIFFMAERATVLELGALGILSMRFGTGSIIDGEDGLRKWPGGCLLVKDFKANSIKLIDVPV